MWDNLEHQVWNNLKQDQLENDPVYLLAVSGGLDSMVLLSVLNNIKPQAQLVLMHYHHGPGPQKKFRDDSVELLKNINSPLIILETETSVDELHSENDFRQARNLFFEKIKLKYKIEYYFTAHHLDDVFETRLLKMIRGTGLEGLISFQAWNEKIYRPFFSVGKETLSNYAEKYQTVWLEDPTNAENKYLRNWIRNEWLPLLDQKMKGASKNIAQSLQNLIDQSTPELDRYAVESLRYVTRIDQSVIIDKTWFFSFNTKDQLSLLIRVVKESFSSDFSTTQIKEVLKRLDKNQNEHIFQVAGINWVINARTIMLKYKG